MPQLTEAGIKQLWLDRALVARVKPWYFLRYFVRTKDEHDATITYKPFPAKLMYRFIARVFCECPIIFCDKSRQIAMTWTIGALLLHDAMFKVNRRQADQSKSPIIVSMAKRNEKKATAHPYWPSDRYDAIVVSRLHV